MRALLYAGAVCAGILCVRSAVADDSSAALGAGGLVLSQSQDIRMADEDLRISPKAVHVRFVFANDSGKDIDTLVAFVLPDIDSGKFWGSPIGTVTDDPVNFMGFSLKADGKPVNVSVEQRAFLKGRDVTEIVKSVGLPINIDLGKGNDRLVALPPAKRKLLTAAGLAEFDKADSSDNAIALWTVRTRFYWRQHFPAGKSVVLEQSYQPVTGQSFFGPMELEGKSDDSNFYSKNFCLDGSTRATLARKTAAAKKSKPDGGGYLNLMQTDYILSTGNNWKGPIGRLHLTLDKLVPDNVISLCWDGKLKRTGPTTFEDTRENFAPKSDIKLLVFADQAQAQ
jgi:Domain of unknown function (DUF4424)